MVSANDNETKEPEGVQYSSRKTDIKYEDDHFNDGLGSEDPPTDTNLQIKTFYYSARALDRIELQLSSMGKLHDLVKRIEDHFKYYSLERYDYISTFTLEVEDAKQLVQDLQNAIIVAERAKNEANND